METQMSAAYQSALETGQTVVRRIFKNNGSNKNQYTVQFQQELELEEGTSTLSDLVAIAQNINPRKRVTALFSFSEDALRKRGVDLSIDNYFASDKVLTAKDLFGREINIQVVENTTPNPLSPNQQPKINPATSEVLTYNRKPIYRHTSIVAGPATHVFLQHNNAETDMMGVSQEEVEMAGAQTYERPVR